MNPHEVISSNYLLDPNFVFCSVYCHFVSIKEWKNEIIYDRQSESRDAYLNEDNEFWIKELLKFRKTEIDWNLYAGPSLNSTELLDSVAFISTWKFSYFIMIYQFWIYDNWPEINSLGRQKMPRKSDLKHQIDISKQMVGNCMNFWRLVGFSTKWVVEELCLLSVCVCL